MTATSHQIGAFVMNVSGDGPISRAIRAEMPGFEIDTGERCDLLVSETRSRDDSLKIPEAWSAGRFGFSDAAIGVKARRFRARFDWQDTPAKLTVQATRLGFLSVATDFLRQLVGAASLRANGATAEEFLSYRHFWLYMHVSMLRSGMAFLHAGAVERGGAALLVIGVGGGGKTSTALSLVADHGYNYLAEDFAVIDEHGLVIVSPRRIAMYSSDIRRAPRAVKAGFYRSLPLEERLIWSLLRWVGRNPRRRLLPDRLLGEPRVGRQAHVRASFFIVRSDEVNAIVINRCESDELVGRAWNASMREILAWSEMSHLRDAVFPQGGGTHSGHMGVETRGIYEGFFERGANFVVTVPNEASPAEIANSIEDTIGSGDGKLT